MVQRIAMRTWNEKEDFKELLLQEEVIADSLTPAELEECFDVKADFKNIDIIYDRVFS